MSNETMRTDDGIDNGSCECRKRVQEEGSKRVYGKTEALVHHGFPFRYTVN